MAAGPPPPEDDWPPLRPPRAIPGPGWLPGEDEDDPHFLVVVTCDRGHPERIVNRIFVMGPGQVMLQHRRAMSLEQVSPSESDHGRPIRLRCKACRLDVRLTEDRLDRLGNALADMGLTRLNLAMIS